MAEKEEFKRDQSRFVKLAWAYRKLRASGKGKHVGAFCYYHRLILNEYPDVRRFLDDLQSNTLNPDFNYNVVKLSQRSRLSFLRYEDFSIAFPALKSALSINLERRTSRVTDYSNRTNPPILHRKELLLPKDDPLVPSASRLTLRLEELGAMRNPKQIGTRNGWNDRLNSLGIRIENGNFRLESCPHR